MFNKKFSGVELDTLQVFKTLEESLFSSKTWAADNLGYKDLYLKKYYLPKFFLPRNNDLGLKFAENELIFSHFADQDLLKECDLTDFILRNKNEVKNLPSLSHYAAGYKMSDEAAWVLMNNPVAPSENTERYNVSSIWFRRFEEEDPDDPVFQEKIIKSIERYRRIHKKAETLFTPAMKVEEILIIQSFQLNESLNREDFLSLDLSVCQSFTTKTLLNEEFYLWYLSNISADQVFVNREIAPFILYSSIVPPELFKKFYAEADEGIYRLNLDFHSTRDVTFSKWKHLLGLENFNKMAKDYFPARVLNFVTSDDLEILDDEALILDLIAVYRKVDPSDLHGSQVKVFKRFLSNVLNKKFGVGSQYGSIEHLISIFENTLEPTV